VTGVIAVFSFDFLMRTLRSYFVDSTARNINVKLSATTFEHLLGMEMASRPKSVGALTNTVQAFESFRDFITSASITVIIDLPFVFLFIAVIAYIAGTTALIPLLAIPLVLFVAFMIQIPLTDLVNQTYRYAAEKQATLVETLGGVENIKGMAAESGVQRKWERITRMSARLLLKVRFLSNVGLFFSTYIQQISTVAVIVSGVYKIAAGELTIVENAKNALLNDKATYIDAPEYKKGFNDLIKNIDRLGLKAVDYHDESFDPVIKTIIRSAFIDWCDNPESQSQFITRSESAKSLVGH